ncbi:biotin/lipoyl-binding protein [Oscillochloris sp. ZM17-4]|uniref:biotin/lipoyl-containing protein n=1 Tax=Oscillochloris sp. ZM17-4 TaxID=2866714 RepID=UPI001C73D7AB|nr:acetyl-CoA carboxylase biotin carboxyl carrier protein subunit [Oscillochloris sp. ZM17-4]MBX0330873.1 biotin/lipoyl-binding protein [Oscillochloris sp. ZM17-4]
MHKLQITIDGAEFTVEVDDLSATDGFVTAKVNGVPLRVAASSLSTPESIQWAVVDTRAYELQIDHELRWIQSWRGRHQIDVRDLDVRVARPVSTDARIKTPIPGIVVRVLVEVGQEVEAGQPVLVLEAMKMENEIRAARAGRVASLSVRAGQSVRLHDLLAEIA